MTTEAVTPTPEAHTHVALPGPDTKLPLATLTVSVGGMIYASCISRIEHKLSKPDGVKVGVNLITESACITFTAPHSNEESEAVVNAAGYSDVVTFRSEAAIANDAPAADGSVSGDTDTSIQPGTTPGMGEREGAPTLSPVISEHVEGRAIIVLVARDTIRDSSADAIIQLHELGIELIPLAGDNEAAARHVADQVGIRRVIAGAPPDDKRDTIVGL